MDNQKRSAAVSNYKYQKEYLPGLKQKLQEEKEIENQLRKSLPREFWDFKNSIVKNGLNDSTDLGGDGDEYAVVSFEDMKNIKTGLDTGKRFPIYRNSVQWGGVDYDPATKRFIDSDTGRVIPNLKKHTKDIFQKYLRDWERNRYWDEEDNEKVINHLKKASKL